MSPPIPVIKEIWSLAGPDPICYFPGCDVRAFHSDGGVFLEMAHICGEKPTSARHDPTLSREETNGSANFVLLCPNHHTQIDNKAQRDKYSPELLRSWRQQNELRAGFYEAPDEICKTIQQGQVVELNDVQSESINNYAAPIVNNYHYYSPGQESAASRPKQVILPETEPAPQARKVESQVSTEEVAEINLRSAPSRKELKSPGQHRETDLNGLAAERRNLAPRRTSDGFPIGRQPYQQINQTVVQHSVKYRIFARLLDYFIWFGLLIIGVCISLPIPTEYTSNLVIAVLTALFVGIYETVNRGRTVGKVAFNLEIRGRDGQEIDTRKVVLRSYNTYLQMLILPVVMLSGEGEATTLLEQVFLALSGILLMASIIVAIFSLVLLITNKETLWDRTSKTLVVQKQKASQVR